MWKTSVFAFYIVPAHFSTSRGHTIGVKKMKTKGDLSSTKQSNTCSMRSVMWDVMYSTYVRMWSDEASFLDGFWDGKSGCTDACLSNTFFHLVLACRFDEEKEKTVQNLRTCFWKCRKLWSWGFENNKKPERQFCSRLERQHWRHSALMGKVMNVFIEGDITCVFVCSFDGIFLLFTPLKSNCSKFEPHKNYEKRENRITVPWLVRVLWLTRHLVSHPSVTTGLENGPTLRHTSILAIFFVDFQTFLG